MRTAIATARARPTLLAGAAILLALTPVLHLAWGLDWTTGFLIAWCLATTTFVLLGSWRLTGHSRADLQRTAAVIDSSAFVILVIAGLVAAASLVAVVFELSGTRCTDAAASCLPALERHGRVALTGATILCSWFFVQMIFAVHYTHTYYGSADGHDAPRGGLDFAGNEEPLFSDFVYFAVSVGATSQTSDTAVPSRRMRRIVTAHAIFAFFFNTTVLALTINIAAGLVG